MVDTWFDIWTNQKEYAFTDSSPIHTQRQCLDLYPISSNIIILSNRNSFHFLEAILGIIDLILLIQLSNGDIRPIPPSFADLPQ